MTKREDDNMMICIGAAGAIRTNAAEVKKLLAGVLDRLESGDSKKAERAILDLREAMERYEWIHKALRGECGPPPSKATRRRHPTAAQLEMAERFAREIREMAAAEADPLESVH